MGFEFTCRGFRLLITDTDDSLAHLVRQAREEEGGLRYPAGLSVRLELVFIEPDW